MRFYERAVGFSFPLLFAGEAVVREWWDDEAERFFIEVNVANRTFGPLFGYRGSFTVAKRVCTREEIPLDVLPVREERRE
jgi:Domain of unknown function (DUF4166)